MDSNAYANEKINIDSAEFSTKKYETLVRDNVGRVDISEETIEKLVKQIEMCNKSICEAIRDGIYTEEEQKRTYSYFHDITEGNTRDAFLNINSTQKDVYGLLEQNLFQGDWGIAELQKYLVKKGIDVKVKNPINETEKKVNGGLAFLGVLAINAWALCHYSRGEK